MRSTQKQITIFTTLVCLTFVTHTACNTKQPPTLQPHRTNSRVKSMLINMGKEAMSFGKEAGKIVISSVRERSDIMIICGAVLAVTGSVILLRTILSDLPKIFGSTAMIGTGAALIFLANQKDAQPIPKS